MGKELALESNVNKWLVSPQLSLVPLSVPDEIALGSAATT